MKSVVLSVVNGHDEVVHRLVIDDTGSGVEIRQEKDCLIAADRSITLDMDHAHCHGCSETGSHAVHELLGLTDDEADILCRWRTRKEDGYSASELGKILDKVVKALNAPDPVCETEHERILLRVESANG